MKYFQVKFLISFTYLVAILGNAIIGMRCKDGLVLVSDNYYVNPASSLVQVHTTSNLYKLDDQKVVGFINQKQHGRKLFRSLKKLMLTHRMLYKQELSIDALAKYARNLVYHEYPEASIIIAGARDTDSQTELSSSSSDRAISESSGSPIRDRKKFILYQITPGGSLFEQNFLSVGKTGNFFPLLFETVLAVKGLQEKSKPLPSSVDPFSVPKPEDTVSLTVEDAIVLLKESISSVMRNDPHSGGKNPYFMVIK